MVLKVSINLPGNAVITLEASEPQLFQQVVSLTLKELPKDLMQMQLLGTTQSESAENGKKVTHEPMSAIAQIAKESAPGPVSESDAPSMDTDSKQTFARFCEEMSPLGDMRRVIVAAEGARRFLGIQGVSEKELGTLFDLAGWRKPAGFLQTLRNAARSKFRWIERFPDCPGYYAVTPIGLDKVVGTGET